MFLDRREVLEVFPGEVDPHVAQTYVLDSLLRKGISDRDVLDTEIPQVLEVTGVVVVQLALSVVGEVCYGTREVGVSVVVVPYIVYEVLRKEGIHRLGERTPECE